MKRTRALPLMLAALLIAAPLTVWAGQSIDGALLLAGPVTVTTDIVVNDDLSVIGDTTGLGNWVLGNDAEADAIALTGVLTQSGVATFAGVTTFSAAVVHSDSVYFANDVVAATFTGALVGDVTGNTASLFQSVAYKGNLPTTSSGEETGELFKNAVGDTGWVADNNSWVQLWP